MSTEARTSVGHRISDPGKQCSKHIGGWHCWHQNGPIGFKGKYETSVPVICCHCKIAGRQRQHTNDWVDFDE